MIGILDYGVGNLKNVKAAVDRLGYESVISEEKSVLEKSDGLILPGVGAFSDSMKMLDRSGLHGFLDEWVKNGGYLFGICLGMQLLYERSTEMGLSEGLGYIKGEITGFTDDVKVPHMGWNELFFDKEDPILSGVEPGEYVYFVHSYYLDGNNPSVAAYTEYGGKVAAVVHQKNIYATQFHPEKSQDTGLRILKNYLNIVRKDRDRK